MADYLQRAIETLLKRGVVIPQGARMALELSLQRHSQGLAGNIIDQAFDRIISGLQSIANPTQEPREDGATATVGDTAATLRAKVLEVLKPFGSAPELSAELNLDFKIKVAEEVVLGAGRFVADQTNLDEYPAWEFRRVYDRDVPRGEEPIAPTDPWPVRFAHAAREAGDEDALRVLKDTGRMVALKSSGVWQALGDGAGGYSDTLGNPFAPFAFNSGFDTEGVSRSETIDLGLLKENEKAQPSDFDFSKLISLQEAA